MNVISRMWLGSPTKEGNSPVCENNVTLLDAFLEYPDKRLRRGNLPALTGKAKYVQRSIVNQYREGKVKSSPVRAVK